MKKIIFILFPVFILSCSESNKQMYESLAIEKANEKNCNSNVELLLTYEKTELWSSFHNKDQKLLCVFTCVNEVCMFSTERD